MYRDSFVHRNNQMSGPTLDHEDKHITAQHMPTPKGTHILVVDDDKALRDILQVSLSRSGFVVTTAQHGEEAIELFQHHEFDLVIMDVMMPVMDGFAACAVLRELSDVPIVILTALNRPDDIVRGFDLGADDYIAKPFTFREVEMRLLAILRRISWIHEGAHLSVIASGDITLNDDEHWVKVRGETVHLTPIEFQLLHYMMSTPNQPISKERLFEDVWGYSLAGGTNLVEVAMRRLREKIESDPSNPSYLVTIRGVGYKFNHNHIERRRAVSPRFEPMLAMAA